MIVRNEAHNLAACLEPVAGLFDEVVIVDTGSCDDTPDIARRFTSNVSSFPWCDDFSAARNATLERSSGDWVFWLDADDRFRPEQAVALGRLLGQLTDRPAAYLMDTVCWSRYECEGARLITHPRLFRRHPDLKWSGRVHEQLRPDPVALGYELLRSDVQIDHVGYCNDALRQRKLQRDARLLRMDYAVDPEDPSTLLHLGLTYARLGQVADARKYLRRLEESNPARGEWMRRVYSTLADLALREGHFDDALATLARGLAAFPGDENLLLLRAEVLYEIDRFAEARETLLELMAAADSQQFRGGAPDDVKNKVAPRKLADIYRIEKSYDQAIATLERVLRVYPTDTLAWYGLGRVFTDAHRRADVEAVAQRLLACPQGEIFSALLRATWHLDHNELAAASQYIDGLIAQVPQMPLPRIMRVEVLSRLGAPLEARIQACRDVLRVQPGNTDAARSLAALEAAQEAARVARQPDQWSTSVVLGAAVPGGVSRV